jgi:hypothetical protein
MMVHVIDIESRLKHTHIQLEQTTDKLALTTSSLIQEVLEQPCFSRSYKPGSCNNEAIHMKTLFRLILVPIVPHSPVMVARVSGIYANLGVIFVIVVTFIYQPALFTEIVHEPLAHSAIYSLVQLRTSEI